jgi:hypothetical protein
MDIYKQLLRFRCVSVLSLIANNCKDNLLLFGSDIMVTINSSDKVFSRIKISDFNNTVLLW